MTMRVGHIGHIGFGRLAALMLAETGILDREARSRLMTCNMSDDEVAARERKVSRQERRHLDRQRQKMSSKRAT